MPRITNASRDKLIARKAQIEARLRDFDAREQQRERKDDTRRKIIYGALAMEHADGHPDFAAVMERLLNRYVVRPGDRKLFDLPPREPDQDKGETGADIGVNEPETGALKQGMESA